MQIRRIAAHQLHTQTGEVLPYGGVAIAENGEILEIFQLDAANPEREGVEFYNGILTPGFVNAHTHMELSFFQLNDPVLAQIRDEILGLDVNNLTPVEALNKLNDIKKILKGK